MKQTEPKKHTYFPYRTIIGFFVTGFVIGLMYAGDRNPVVLTFVGIAEVFYIVFVGVQIVLAFADSFGDSKFHFRINIVRVIDIYFSFLLSSTFISFMLWHFDLSKSRTWSYTLGNAQPADAYQVLFSYTLLLIGTGGIAFTEPNSPLSDIWAGAVITAGTIMQTTMVAASIGIAVSNVANSKSKKKTLK